MKPLRILIPTYQGVIAGSTMSISYLAKGLSKKGHYVIIACKSDSLYAELLEGTDVKIEYLPFKNKWDKKSIQGIRDIVLRDKIDIINAQASYDRYISIFARWIYKLPVKLVHTRRQMPMSVGGIQSWFYTKGTDQIIAVSYGVKDALVKKGMHENHITVIYNGTPKEKYEGIDLKEVEALKTKYNLAGNTRVIGCISRLKKHKQVVDALALIDQPITAFFLGFTAEQIGIEAVKLAQQKHTLHFLGLVDPKKALAYYKLFNLYILPSEAEGLSQTVLEAMYMGNPVLATRAHWNLDIIKENENGVLFENENPKDLAIQIEKVLGDDILAKKLSQGSIETAHVTFNIERTIDNYEKYFYQLIDS